MTFNNELFFKFRDFIHQNFGIYYADTKYELLRLKIDKCLLKSGIDNYNDYYKLITTDVDGSFLRHFVDIITVNKTDFFREIEHFNFLRSEFDYIVSKNPSIVSRNEMKVWSMACATGEEPYTLAMVLLETYPKDLKIKILATDLSNRVLKVASSGIYPADIQKELDSFHLEKYFDKMKDQYKVKAELKRLITFRQFNLMHPFPFSGQFDIIFCKNVMIYFDLETQKELLEKIYQYLAPGGLLFIGQSESILNKNHHFKHLKSTIYLK